MSVLFLPGCSLPQTSCPALIRLHQPGYQSHRAAANDCAGEVRRESHWRCGRKLPLTHLWADPLETGPAVEPSQVRPQPIAVITADAKVNQANGCHLHSADTNIWKKQKPNGSTTAYVCVRKLVSCLPVLLVLAGPLTRTASLRRHLPSPKTADKHTPGSASERAGLIRMQTHTRTHQSTWIQRSPE